MPAAVASISKKKCCEFDYRRHTFPVQLTPRVTVLLLSALAFPYSHFPNREEFHHE